MLSLQSDLITVIHFFLLIFLLLELVPFSGSAKLLLLPKSADSHNSDF